AKRAARDLLAAAVGKVLEKNIKTLRETKRDCRDRGLALGKVGIDLTCNLNISASFFEIPAANVGRIGNGRAHAERSAPPGFDSITAGHKFDFAGAEHVVDTETQLHALLAPFSDSQFLCRRSQDRQLRGRLGVELDFRVCAGTFYIIRDRHAGLKFVTRSSQHRHAWRNDKRSANERVAVSRSGG